MDERDDWSSFSRHCPNCGDLVTGYKNREGFIKVECGTCHSVMKKLNQVLVGYYHYYGITDNFDAIERFRNRVEALRLEQ